VVINILVNLESAAFLAKLFAQMHVVHNCEWRQVSTRRQKACEEPNQAHMKRLDAWIIYTRLYLRVELIFQQFGRQQ